VHSRQHSGAGQSGESDAQPDGDGDGDGVPDHGSTLQSPRNSQFRESRYAASISLSHDPTSSMTVMMMMAMIAPPRQSIG
jgi:hypothetical protein